MAKPHCPKCKGVGFIVRTGRELKGGKLVRTFEYKEECLWCFSASTYQAKMKR